MKKVLFFMAAAAILTSCGNIELEEVYNQYEEVSVDKEKKDPNFLIFKDRTQSGKESK